MSLINLLDAAKNLPNSWASQIISTIDNVNFKVVKMDEHSYPIESHDFSEVLLVVDGQMNLVVNDALVIVKTGEAYVVPANTPHAVSTGSFGTLVILDK